VLPQTTKIVIFHAEAETNSIIRYWKKSYHKKLQWSFRRIRKLKSAHPRPTATKMRGWKLFSALYASVRLLPLRIILVQCCAALTPD